METKEHMFENTPLGI